jgi:pimeloyl-ACP methyl ester carboxylesterase
MATAHLDGADINFEVVGDDGPWIAVISGGRHPLGELEPVAGTLARRGFRVLLHDRRNCGRSSFDFASTAPEEFIWADDVARLLTHLGITELAVFGRSRGARVAMRFVLRYPQRVRALGMWGLSGGPQATDYLDRYYYDDYLRAVRASGMEGVCATGHFANVMSSDPAQRERLLAVDPQVFIAAMERWRAEFDASAQTTVMSFDDAELQRISVPTVLMPFYDWLHPRGTLDHAHNMIAGSELVDFDPQRRDRPSITGDEDLRDQTVVASLFADFLERCGIRASNRSVGARIRQRLARAMWRRRR